MTNKPVEIRGKKRMTENQSAQTPLDEDTLKKFRAFVRKCKKHRKENNDTQADIVTLKYIRNSAIELLPIAISQYKMWKNDRAMISFRNIVEQVKDTLIALRTQEKGANECDHIVNGIITPDMQVLLKRNVASINQIKGQLSFLKGKERKQVNELLDQVALDMGNNFNIVHTMLLGKIRSFLIGE